MRNKLLKQFEKFQKKIIKFQIYGEKKIFLKLCFAEKKLKI